MLWALAALGVEAPPAAEALRRQGWEAAKRSFCIAGVVCEGVVESGDDDFAEVWGFESLGKRSVAWHVGLGGSGWSGDIAMIEIYGK